MSDRKRGVKGENANGVKAARCPFGIVEKKQRDEVSYFSRRPYLRGGVITAYAANPPLPDSGLF